MKAVTGVSGKIWTGDSFETGWLAWKGTRIVATGRGNAPRAHAGGLLRLGRRKVLPGFVDTLLHGYGGHDAGEADAQGLQELSLRLARTGVTTALAGLYPMEPAKLEAAAEAWSEWSRLRGAPVRSRFPGWHLEGPFIPPEMRGGLPSHGIAEPSAKAARALLKDCGGWLYMTTLAPELKGAMAVARVLHENKVIPSIGHTAAEFEDCVRLAERGRVAVTHLGNRMPAMAARHPGPVGFALSGGARWVGVIPDGVHVLPTTLNLFASTPSMRDSLMFTSDNLSHAGLKAARFRAGGQILHRDGSVARNGRKGLSGTLDSLPELLIARISDGSLTWEQAIRGGCQVPGALVGRCGQLKPGFRADLLALDNENRVQQVWVGGRTVQAD